MPIKLYVVKETCKCGIHGDELFVLIQFVVQQQVLVESFRFLFQVTQLVAMNMVVMEFVSRMSCVIGEIIEGSFDEQNKRIGTLKNKLNVAITT